MGAGWQVEQKEGVGKILSEQDLDNFMKKQLQSRTISLDIRPKK